MDYQIKLRIQETVLVFPVTWEVGIEQVMEISKSFEKENWTRNSSVDGVINGCGLYADLYNEGSVILKKII